MTARSFAPSARRIAPAFSPQKLPRQAPLGARVRSFAPTPALPAKQAYLKALRQAELAAWESTPAKDKATSASAEVSLRLPSPPRDKREGWLYAVLTGLCAALLGHELWTAFQAAGNWHNFVQYVRALLA
jgi:hypothetical protein